MVAKTIMQQLVEAQTKQKELAQELEATKAQLATAQTERDAMRDLLCRVYDGVNDEYHPMFASPLFTDTEQQWLKEVNGLLGTTVPTVAASATAQE